MSTYSVDLDNTGLEVIDLSSDREFAERELHPRDAIAQLGVIQRLMQAFLTKPEMLLQQLVDAAVELCGADSAGISIEQAERMRKASITGSPRRGSTQAFWTPCCRGTPALAASALDAGGHSTSA